MIVQKYFTPKHIQFVVNDLCFGGYPDILRRHLSGYILSQEEREYLDFIYTGETAESNTVNELEKIFEEAAGPYIQWAMKDMDVGHDAKVLFDKYVEVWSQAYFKCTVDDIPFENRSELQAKCVETYKIINGELRYLADAFAIQDREVYLAFQKAIGLMHESFRHAQSRNSQITTHVQELINHLDKPEQLNTIELSMYSMAFVNMAIPIYRENLLLQCLRQTSFPQDLTKGYQQYIAEDLSCLRSMLNKVEELHFMAWGNAISPDTHYVLQPIPFYCNYEEPVEPSFIMRLNYNLARVLLIYFSVRLNFPKQKKIDVLATFYLSQPKDIDCIYHFVNSDSWSAEERLEIFLDLHFPICYFHGPLHRLAKDFGLSPTDFQLLSADYTVAIYEWKTRLFIQLPLHLSSETQMSVLQHTIDQYIEAIQKYNILHHHHD